MRENRSAVNSNRQILRLALPSIVSNITVPLLGLVDVAIVGHMGDAAFIGAIAVGSMIFNLLYWLFGFLRMGTSGLTSQSLGRRDMTEVMRLLVSSLAVAQALALCFIVLQVPIRSLFLLFMRPTTDVESLAVTYFNICIWGAPAMMGINSMSGWFIGMQNTRTPMFVAIMQNIVNIVASLVLVLVFDMQIQGVAMGTVIAQWTGFLVALLAWRRHYGRHFTGFALSPSMGRFFSVNRDIFVRTLFLVAVNLFFTAAGARQGSVVLAVNTLLMQLFLLFSYVMDGFAYAGEALSGRYYGAANYVAFRDVVRRVFGWGALLVVLFTVVYAVGGTSFLHLLTDEPSVVAASANYFFWALLVPVLGVTAFVWDGVFIGITATRGMLLSAVLAATVFFATFFVLQPSLGNHALWLAFMFFLAVRGIVQTVWYRIVVLPKCR